MGDLTMQRTQLVTEAQREFTGFAVVARDGKIGTIDAATNETSPSHIVVSTGFWIFGALRIISARVVKSIDYGRSSVNVSLTREQVKSCPRYRSGRVRDNNDRINYRSN